jgi:hypothetical protein
MSQAGEGPSVTAYIWIPPRITARLRRKEAKKKDSGGWMKDFVKRGGSMRRRAVMAAQRRRKRARLKMNVITPIV